MMAFTDGADAAPLLAQTSDQAAQRILENVALRWAPSSCASVAKSGTTLTVTLTDCTGPRGLLHVSGVITLQVSISGSSEITVVGHSDDLTVNKANIVFDVTAV